MDLTMPEITTFTSPVSRPQWDTTVTTYMESATDKPYEEFAEVKAAILIDRIYIPVVVGVGLLGNFLCFAALVFTSLRTTSTCVYMAAIAVLDCVILVIDFLVLIRGYLGHTIFYIRNDWTCGLFYFLFYFSIHFDVMLLLAMNVDRFIVVKFPLKAQSLCTPRSALKAITALGLISFGLNIQILFTRRLSPVGSSEDPLKCVYPDANVDFFMRKIYTWIDSSIYSFIPFLSLLVLNTLIIRQLHHSRKFSQQFTDQRGGKTAMKSNSMKAVTESDTHSSDVSTSNTDASVNDVRITVTANRREGWKNTPTISGGQSGNREDGGTGSTKKVGTNTNITVMLILVSLAFLVLTSPVAIVLLYKRYHWLPSTNAERARARLAHAFVDNLMFTNHAINFLLYCISGRRFRLELKRLLTRFCCRS